MESTSNILNLKVRGFWYGTDENVAGRKNIYDSPMALRHAIEAKIDSTLQPLIDVFVLDLSKK
jgi:hypothetical protein